MISVKKIKYNDLYSNDLNPGPDLICNLAFDSDDGGTDSWLNREAVASETYRGEFKRVHNYKYTDTLSPQFTFMKEDFSDFTLTEQRAVLAWLTSKSTASYLSVYYGDCESDSAELAYELLGGFTEIELYKMGNGRVVGIVATFESVAPYAFSPVKSEYRDLIGHSTYNLCPYTLTIKCNTDEVNSYIYPKITMTQSSVAIEMKDDFVLNTGLTTDENIVISDGFKADIIPNTLYHIPEKNKYFIQKPADNTITIGSGLASTYPGYGDLKSSIIIKNNTIGTKTQITNVSKLEKITIDGTNQIITSSSNRIFGDDFNWQWLPLQRGTNEISVIGNVSGFTLEWREPMKVGEV